MQMDLFDSPPLNLEVGDIVTIKDFSTWGSDCVTIDKKTFFCSYKTPEGITKKCIISDFYIGKSFLFYTDIKNIVNLTPLYQSDSRNGFGESILIPDILIELTTNKIIDSRKLLKGAQLTLLQAFYKFGNKIKFPREILISQTGKKTHPMGWFNSNYPIFFFENLSTQQILFTLMDQKDQDFYDRCPNCNSTMNSAYLKMLYEQGTFKEDFKFLCYECKVELKVGLQDKEKMFTYYFA